MSKTIEITLNNDSNWGDTDMTGIDESASESMLEQMVADEVKSEYPDFDVEVSSAQLMRTEIEIYDGTDDPTSDDEENIREIVSRVWSGWEWVVEK